MNDGDDVDAKPAGRPGADGDGFSVYEEYRGFYVNGTHEFLDPQLKDVFVLNQVGSRADNALRKFRQLSGLTVYEEKQAGLIYSLNRNRREDDHRRRTTHHLGQQCRDDQQTRHDSQ